MPLAARSNGDAGRPPVELRSPSPLETASFRLACGHVVQQLPPATSNPPFCSAILPGRLNARPLGIQTRCLQEGDDTSVELRVAVEDHVTIGTGLRKGFAQLLDHPLGSRVWCHAEVQNPAPPMLHDEEAVKQLERQRWHGEEVEGNDHLAVILEESQPALAALTAAADTSQVPRHGSFGNLEAKLLQLSVDLGSAPIEILIRHAVDERADFSGAFRPATARS